MASESLYSELSKKYGALKLWVLIGICVGAFIVLILGILSIWVMFQRRSKRASDKFSACQIPNISKEISVDRVGEESTHDHPEALYLTINDKPSDKKTEKMLVHLGRSRSSDADNISQSSSVYHYEMGGSSQSGEEGSSGHARKQSSMSYGIATASPLIGLPEISHLGWGHWFTLRDLEIATSRFSAENIIGEGGYGVVYRGKLANGSEVAVKKLLNNL